MSINEEELKKRIEQMTKKLAHLEANLIAIINGDFCDANTESKEPLIKDRKIRKVVRLCAGIWGADKILVIKSGSRIEFSDGSPNMRYVSFIYAGWQDEIKDRTYYTIEELCGEEEAPEPIEPTFIDLDERVKGKREE